LQQKGIAMNGKNLLLLLFLLVLMAWQAADAEEGMFLLDQIAELHLEKHGCSLPATALWNPQDGGISQAVVSLGGCTASFVSPMGLIITNHHCAEGALQRNSSPEHNLLETGFLAESIQQELPTHGTRVYVLLSFEDVTTRVAVGTSAGMAAEERRKIIDANKNTLILAEEKKDSTIDVRIVDMYAGERSILYRSMEIRDVRLVYAPPQTIGVFGGDIDNFEWPRHTGDYTFLRAYVGPDGRPADPADHNIPYRPTTWLTISSEGYQENDFCMVIGYPGSTGRYLCASDIDYRQNSYYPWRIHMMSDYIELLEKVAAADSHAAIQVASLVSSLNNSLKNSRGQLDGLLRTRLSAEKQAMESAWLQKYGPKSPQAKLLQELNEQYQEFNSIAAKYTALSWLTRYNQLLSVAQTALRWAEEREKPEAERKPGYMDRDMANYKERLRHRFRNYNPDTDRRTLVFFYEKAAELTTGQNQEWLQALAYNGAAGSAPDFEITAQKLYAQTIFTDLSSWLNLFDMSTEQLQRSPDPLLKLAVGLYKQYKPLQEKERLFDARLDELQRQYLQLARTEQPGPFYPDANGTKRLTYGTIKGYSPRDAVAYSAFTTTDGILQKYTGTDPFDAPQKLLELVQSESFANYRDPVSKKMHVNLLTTLDTTGGNSGSPVLNGEGKLIGLLFDGNYESIVADYRFDSDLSRSICVDIRYILWLMAKFSQANWLLQEMQIPQDSA